MNYVTIRIILWHNAHSQAVPDAIDDNTTRIVATYLGHPRGVEPPTLYDRRAGTHAWTTLRLYSDVRSTTGSEAACHIKASQDFLEMAWHATQIGAKTLGSRPASVYHKGDRDLVTDIDLAIQCDIADYLTRATPEIRLLAEESQNQPDIKTAEWLWVLDPVDGTSNFVHGLPLCSVSLALLHCGSAVVAVTEAPLLGRTYHAVEHNGAFLNGQPISTSDTNSLDESIVSLGDYAVGTGAATQNQQRLALTAELVPRVERIRMVGAATLDLAFVAEGALDACIMMSNRPWDTAAGTLMAREAGARVTDAHGELHTHQSAATIAAAPAIADQLGTIIQATNTGGALLAGRTA